MNLAFFRNPTRQIGGAECAVPENETKSQGWKMQDLENDGLNWWKMMDQITRLESAYTFVVMHLAV